jgi:hypothetical protein
LGLVVAATSENNDASYEHYETNHHEGHNS